MPDPTAHKLEARRQAEEVADDILGLMQRMLAEALKRAGIIGNQTNTANFVGPLFEYGGPFVDTGSGSVPLEDSANGQGGGTGLCLNGGPIIGVTALAQVPPATGALIITLYINGSSIGTVSLGVGVSALAVLAADAGLSVAGLNQGDVFTLDFTGTDGTVAGVHVTIRLRSDVQRGVG